MSAKLWLIKKTTKWAMITICSDISVLAVLSVLALLAVLARHLELDILRLREERGLN